MAMHSPDGTDRPKQLRVIRLKEVKRRMGLSHSAIYRLIKDGSFPKPHFLGGPIVARTEAEMDEWIAGVLGYPPVGNLKNNISINQICMYHFVR